MLTQLKCFIISYQAHSFLRWVTLFIVFKGGEPMWSNKPVQEPPTAAAERSASLCVCQQQTGEQQLNASKTQSQVELSHLRYPGTDRLGQGSNLRGGTQLFLG